MRIITEGTATELAVARRGDDNSLTLPTTLKYRVDCLTTGQAVTGWTDLTPSSITSISVPATSNAIISDANTYEDKIVTVMADEGLDTQEVYEQRYRVRNLSGVG